MPNNDKHHLDHLRELTATLPTCCAAFLGSIADTTTIRTRIAYAYDLGIFMKWLREYRGVELADCGVIGSLSAYDLELYQQSLTEYSSSSTDSPRTNSVSGKMRKMASLRSFMKYLFKHNLIPSNQASIIDLPKLREKPVIYLEPNEAAKLIDEAELGANLTIHQLSYHDKLSLRDTAMLTLMLGTGIRVSECVGLDLTDINLDDNAFRVTRKGGDETILFFGDEVAAALKAYCAERSQLSPIVGHETALFLSLQRRRITQRAVQNLVKKYARLAAPLKKITPHKLRSTFGTQLYKESGDLYMVADVLGHSDVNTTRKHYAAIGEDSRRDAARIVKLRK